MKSLKDLNIEIFNLGKDYLRANDGTKQMIYKINGKMLLYGNTVISKDEAIDLLNTLREYGKKLDKICTSTSYSKLLPLFREYYKALNGYIKDFEWVDEDIHTLQKLINYNVANYIREKKTVGLNPESITKHLQYMKRTYKIINDSPYMDRLKLKSFMEMNKELLKEYSSIFKL